MVALCQQGSSISLTVLHDDVQDFLSYVNGYYRLQVTRSNDDDDDDDDDGLVIHTANQRCSSSSSENGLTFVHRLNISVFKEKVVPECKMLFSDVVLHIFVQNDVF